VKIHEQSAQHPKASEPLHVNLTKSGFSENFSLEKYFKSFGKLPDTAPSLLGNFEKTSNNCLELTLKVEFRA
jgi:hypothetical protein